MGTDGGEKPTMRQLFFTAYGFPGDESQNGDEANDQGKSQYDEKDRLTIRIIPDPSLEISHQDSSTDQACQHSSGSIDQEIGPERSARSLSISGKQNDLVVNRLADGEKYPYPSDPQDLLQFASGPENLEKTWGFRSFRMLMIHGGEIGQLWCKGN